MKYLLNLLLVGLFLAQVRGAEEGEASLRFLAQDRPEVLASVKLVAAGKESAVFDLPTRNLSPVIPFGEKAFFLQSATEPTIRVPIGLPETGRGFVVLLLLDKEAGLKPVIVPTNLPSFRQGDIFLHNLTTKKIVGKLGTSRFSVEANSSKFVRPTGDVDGIFDIAIGAVDGDAVRPITTSRWPEEKSNRTYLLFFEDSQSGRVKFRAIEEYVRDDG